MKNIFLICLFTCLSLQIFAQKRVTGTVNDEAGVSIIGATVVQKGTSNGTVTDMDGKFSIVLDDQKDAILQVSMMGYDKAIADVKSVSTIDIVLHVANTELNEVVVVGYGTQNKASITGAISNVGDKDLQSVPVSSVTNALTGRVAGLVTRQESGRPGGDAANMFIRGRSSFNSSSPLVLVDGIERDFSQVDPDDIESVSILKDASATAVYGVRGANGVVLVTTKRGKEGKTSISFSSEYGITEFNRVTKALNAETTSRFQREGVINVGLDPSILSNTSNIPVSEYDNYLYRTQLDPFNHPDNSFVDEFTKPGAQQKYNFNISGGNPAVKYFVSVGYFSQDGMFETNVNKLREKPTLKRLIELSPAVDKALVQPDYDADYYYHRLTTRSNIDINLTKDFKIGIDLSYRFGKQNRPGTYDGLTSDAESMRLFGMFYRNAPQAFPLMNPNGSFAAATGLWRQNPLVTLAYTGFYSNYKNSLESNVNFNYDLHSILKGLTIDGKFSYDAGWGNWRGMQWRPYIYSYNPANDVYTQGLNSVLPGQGSGKTAASYDNYAETALRYKRTFGKHTVSAVALVNYSSESGPSTTEYTYVPHVYQALIGRVNYDYDTRYLLEINAGYNGSNRFAEGHRYQMFPAASAGWVVTNEKFYPKNNVLNYLKIRGSAGQVGNDDLGSFSYYYNSTYVNGTNYSFGVNPIAQITGLLMGKMSNMNITWETSTKYNLGFDTYWFDSQLTFNADLFKEHRTNILTNPALYSITSGINGVAPANLGVVDNQGYELELGWNSKMKHDFSYFAKVLFSDARNTVKQMSESLKPYDYMYSTGNPIGQFIGYKFDGFFKSYQEIASSPQQFGLSNLAPGDIKYKDLNNDGIIDQNDQCPIGYSPVPEMTYSLQLGCTYKDLDFSVMFQGASRSSVYMVSDLGWDNAWGNYYDNNVNRWTPETAATADYPRFLQKADGNNQNYYASDFWLINGDYLRLKNIQLGYSLPKSLMKKTFIKTIRFYANAFNLITWDKVKKVDPESNPEKNNGYFYPQQRIMNFGMTMNF